MGCHQTIQLRIGNADNNDTLFSLTVIVSHFIMWEYNVLLCTSMCEFSICLRGSVIIIIFSAFKSIFVLIAGVGHRYGPNIVL